MSKEELIEFLRQNLNIVIVHNPETYYSSEELIVKLGLGDEVISEYSCNVYEGYKHED